jgi:hypothetical protein
MPVPFPPPKSDTNTLPDPELNPLLNPLLAAHMGRWAEVYFTAPPEKREQAVSELLRELKNASASEPASAEPDSAASGSVEDGSAEYVSAQPGSVQVFDHAIDSEKAEAAASEIAQEFLPISGASPEVCGVCAHKNAAGQKFCGMCGAPLQISPEAHIPPVEEAVPISAVHWDQPESPSSDSVPEHSVEPVLAHTAADRDHDALKSAWTLPERDLPHFAMNHGAMDHGDVETESPAGSYRVYAGALLAILLALLLYMVWRGNKAISGTAGTQAAASRTTPSVAPAAAPAAVPAEAPAAPTAAAPQPEASSSAPAETTPAAPAAPTRKRPAAVSRKAPPARPRRSRPIVNMASNTATLAADTTGADDMATAEKYMNGTQGMPRDRKEAAQWLWKAVGKGNLSATVTLSDLYLRGDGVPKSCDQARLLLDAAARKGGTAAANRLRNLQAFGCE